MQRLESHGVRHDSLRSRWLIEHGVGSGNGPPVGPVQVLPNEMHPIDIAMMEVKSGLQWTEIKVATRVSSNGIVAPSMDAHPHPGCGGARPAVPLNDGLEGVDVLRLEDGIRGCLKAGVALAELGAELSLDTPGVVLQRVRGPDGADVDGHVGEGPGREAAAAATADGGFGTVENRRLFDARVAIQAPLPVGEDALVERALASRRLARVSGLTRKNVPS
jgi:hypothetical protein